MHLTERQAALHLGITPELLMKYVRHAPKQDGAKLRYLREVPGFSQTDLDDWNAHLRAPWASALEPRPSIPAYIRQYASVEASGMCALCRSGHPLDIAHIVPWATCRNHHHHNLLLLCKSCHSKFDDGILSPSELHTKKQELVAQLRQALDEKSPMQSPQRVFVGRYAELSWLEASARRHRAVQVVGLPGSGKTELVRNWLRDRDCDVPPTYLDTVPLTRPADLLRTLRPGGMIVFDNFEASLSDTDESLSWLESLISEAPKGITIIVVSQRTLSTRWIDDTLEVGCLPAFDVREIFAAMCPVQWGHEPTNDRAIVEACGGHPLTVRLVASLVRYYGSTWIVARRMREQAISISEPGRSQHDKHTSLALAMSLMWGELDERTRRLVLVSTLLGGNISPRLSLLYLSLTFAEFEDGVASCREWSMLGSAGLSPGDRLAILPPVCSFVRSTAEFQSFQISERAGILRWIADILVGISRHYDDSTSIFECYDQEIGIIDAATMLLDDQTHQAHMSIAIATGQYFFARDRGRERLDFLSRGADIAESLSEIPIAMTILETMASICRRYKLTTDLEEILKRVERLVQTAEPCDVFTGTIARLSEMAVSLGLRPLDTRVDMRSLSDGESPQSLALTYAMQATSLRRQGEFVRAIELFERAQELLSESQRDAFNLACINFECGCCRADLRLWADAWQDLVAAVCGFVRLRSREYAFNSIAELGTVFPWLGYDPALLDGPIRRAVDLCAREYGRVLPEYLTGELSWDHWRRLLETLSSLIVLGLRGGFDISEWTDQLMRAWERLPDGTPSTPPLAILHDSITFLACLQKKRIDQQEFEQLVEGIGDLADDLFIRLDTGGWLDAWSQSRLPANE